MSNAIDSTAKLPTISGIFDEIISKLDSPSAKITKLSAERESIYNRIEDAAKELDKKNVDSLEVQFIQAQLRHMRCYKDELTKRIKFWLDRS